MGADTIEQCVSTSCNMEHFLALSTYVSPRQNAHNSRCAKLSFQDSRLLGSTYQQCRREFDKSKNVVHFSVAPLSCLYLDYLRRENGNLSFCLLNSYIYLLEILLEHLRASREDNWKLHLWVIISTTQGTHLSFPRWKLTGGTP